MNDIVRLDRVAVQRRLHEFLGREVIPDVGVDERMFWPRFAALIAELTPINEALLNRRDELQARIDDWHRRHPGAGFDRTAYEAFLREIGYLTPEPAPFQVGTANVDPEIATIAGQGQVSGG